MMYIIYTVHDVYIYIQYMLYIYTVHDVYTQYMMYLLLYTVYTVHDIQRCIIYTSVNNQYVSIYNLKIPMLSEHKKISCNFEQDVIHYIEILTLICRVNHVPRLAKAANTLAIQQLKQEHFHTLSRFPPKGSHLHRTVGPGQRRLYKTQRRSRHATLRQFIFSLNCH